MGCFLACFGGAKDRKRRQRSSKSQPFNRVNQAHRSLQQASPSPRKPVHEDEVIEALQTLQANPFPQNPIDEVTEAYQSLQASPFPEKSINEVTEACQSLQANPSPEKIINEVTEVSVPRPRENQEQGGFISCKKKVTFDPDVKTNEDVSFVGDTADEIGDEDGKDKREPEESKEKASTGTKAFPVNHRYQNCENSDDDGLDDGDNDDGGDSDFGDEEDEGCVLGSEEESSDSFFSLPIDKESEQENSQEEVESPVPINLLSKGNARDRSQYVHLVLNPVENLSQWKEMKLGVMPLKNADNEINSQLESGRSMETPDKENMKPEPKRLLMKELSREPIFKVGKAQEAIDVNRSPGHITKDDISVDASLSTWLVSSGSSPKETPRGSNSQWSNSSVSKEDQPILGALTIEDLKHSSVTSSPRKSPSRNPDDIPILGTVGRYWYNRDQYSDTKGFPNTTSKYREDKTVNWHSTPFEVRLERALNKGAASW